MELKLIKQTNVDKFTVNELYVNDEVEVELKIKQLEEDKDVEWNYNGVLIIKRDAKREAVAIAGKLGC
jgi:ribosomal protein L19